jgi:hypothetical protein
MDYLYIIIKQYGYEKDQHTITNETKDRRRNFTIQKSVARRQDQPVQCLPIRWSISFSSRINLSRSPESHRGKVKQKLRNNSKGNNLMEKKYLHELAIGDRFTIGGHKTVYTLTKNPGYGIHPFSYKDSRGIEYGSTLNLEVNKW